MSIDQERELRVRLDSALHEITPSPAPVAATLRNGRTIRTRRRIGVAAGLAAAVGIALAAPGLAHQIASRGPAAPVHSWVVTAYLPGPHPPHGEIAWGTINGRRWQITATNERVPGGDQCVQGNFNGQNGSLNCGASANASQDRSLPVAFQGSGEGDVTYQYGVVQPDVARVVIALADGTNLTLHPVPLYGQRWVAFAVPANLPIASAAAYSKRSELAYAIPYGISFPTWLRPGEAGPPSATYVIASGVVNGVAWSDVMHVGPWGYCSAIADPSVADTVCSPLQSVTGNSPRGLTGIGHDSVVEGNAAESVAYVVGTLTDGGTVRARAVDAGGPRFWAFFVPQGQRLRRVVFYSATGHRVAVQSGAEYNRGLV
jgi:hypothetical protein